MSEPKAWCVNFDGSDEVLAYGITNKLWLMQYQYAHAGHVFQGSPEQVGATTKNWRRIKAIEAGDFLVAYTPKNRFFAIGEARVPRKQQTTKDSIDRVVAERKHNDEGVVGYTDVFYEDFSDRFNVRIVNPYSNRMEIWRYNQRIDVEEWKLYVAEGVMVSGMNSLQPRPDYRSAAFEIPLTFFEDVKSNLIRKADDGKFTHQLRQAAAKAQKDGYFDPSGMEDEKERVLREVVHRRGQPEFRRELIEAYSGCCAVTGCDALPALEAAHIISYMGSKSDHVSNGLLLRADIHTLFDLCLIGVHPDSLEIVVAEELKDTQYAEIAGLFLRLPKIDTMRPSVEAMKLRWGQFVR